MVVKSIKAMPRSRSCAGELMVATCILQCSSCWGFYTTGLSGAIVGSSIHGFQSSRNVLAASRPFSANERKIRSDHVCALQMKENWPSRLKSITSDVNVLEHPLRTFGILAVWVMFGLYALVGTPNELSGASADIFVQCLNFQDSTVNPLFQALFCLFGLYNVIFAAILLPLKPRAEKLPAWPFLSLTWALGLGAIAPYLALMRYDADAEKIQDAGFLARRETGVMALLLAIPLTLYGVGFFAPNNINGGSDFSVDVLLFSYLKAYPTLFSTNKFVNLTTIDSSILLALLLKPLREDLKWRGWFDGSLLDWALFASIVALPFVGPCVWLAIRPDPPSEPRKSQ